jgi:UDP-glucose 4-epimerase
MTVALLTGAGGFIGQHLSQHLARAGVEVRKYSRADSSLTPRSSSNQWSRTLDGIDAIYHLAGIAHRTGTTAELELVNAHWPARLYQAAAAAGVGRFIYLSSIKVLGDRSVSPLRVADSYAPGNAYAASKVHAEQALLAVREASTRLAIVRPPLTYGPGVKANFLSLLRLARLSQKGLPLPLAGATARRSILGVGNLCDLLQRLLDTGEGIFHAADAEALSVSELLSLIGELSGKSVRLWGVPTGLLEATMRGLGQADTYSRLFHPLEIDQRDTQRLLQWSPPYGTENQLLETLQWLR